MTPQDAETQKRAEARSLFCFIFALVVIICLPNLGPLLRHTHSTYHILGGPQVFCNHDHLRNWRRFYNQGMHKEFVLPPEIHVVAAQERHESGGEFHDLRFRLPATQRPDAWLAQIARASGLSEQPRPCFYYRGKSGMFSRLTYDPIDQTYTAVHSVWWNL